MPIAYSNALNNKINPNPLPPISGMFSNTPSVQSSMSFLNKPTPIAVPSMKTGTIGAQNAAPAKPAPAAPAAPVATPTSAPTTGLSEQNVRDNLTAYYKNNPQTSGNFGTQSKVGTTQYPDSQSPAKGGVPQVAPAAPYQPTDQSPEATTYRQNNPTNPQPGLIQNLLNVSQANPAVGQARQQLLAYNQAVLDKQNAIDATGADLAFKQGEQQTLQRTAQAGLQARQEAVQNALQEQGLQQQAAGQAASLAAPVSQFGVLTNPQTGQAVSGGNIGSLAFQGGQIQGQQAAGQQSAGMQAANVAAKGIQNSITSYLQQNPQLNPSDATFANAISQWVSGQQLGDPKYQTLANYLNEYISTLAPILGVGGDTTNLKTQIAQSMLNARASGQSIIQVLQNLSSLADQKVQNFASGAQGGGVVAGNTPQAPQGGQYSGYSGW